MELFIKFLNSQEKKLWFKILGIFIIFYMITLWVIKMDDSYTYNIDRLSKVESENFNTEEEQLALDYLNENVLVGYGNWVYDDERSLFNFLGDFDEPDLVYLAETEEGGEYYNAWLGFQESIMNETEDLSSLLYTNKLDDEEYLTYKMSISSNNNPSQAYLLLELREDNSFYTASYDFIEEKLRMDKKILYFGEDKVLLTFIMLFAPILFITLCIIVLNKETVIENIYNRERKLKNGLFTRSFYKDKNNLL